MCLFINLFKIVQYFILKYKNHTPNSLEDPPCRSYFVTFIGTVFHNKYPRDSQQEIKYKLRKRERNDTYFLSPRFGPCTGLELHAD
jgi:hypothetical protein